MLRLGNVRFDASQWGVSVVVHVIAIFVVALFYVESGAKPTTVVTVVSELNEINKLEEFEELKADAEIQLYAPVSLTGGGGGGGGSGGGGVGTGIGAAQGLQNPMQAAAQVAAATQAIGTRTAVRPLLGRGVGGLSLDSNVGGLKGTSEIVGGGGGGGGGPGGGDGTGDAGTVDRITQEILRQIDKDKVIVAWILDSTKSLAERREKIAARLDRVYHELDVLGVNKADALLTTVVAVGERTQFLIDKPTNDVEVIQKAFRSVKEDGSGVENLCSAIRETALKYRRISTGGQRSLMLVLLTDEIGDDLDITDETVEMLVRNKVPLYCMASMASFSRPTIHETWIDTQTGFHFWIPIKRGPYTRMEEILRVPFTANFYRSGFGPFNLTQLTRESGGIFFVYDDERIPGIRYDADVLVRYKANYGPEQEYQEEIKKSKLATVLMGVVAEGNKTYDGHGGPWGWIHHDDWRQTIEERAQFVAKFLEFSRRAIPALEAVEKEFAEEPSPKWRGCYDLSYARLLMAKVRADEFMWSVADFKLNPRTLKDPKANNGWHYYFTDKVNVGTKPGERDKTPAKSAGEAPKNNVKIQADPKEAVAAKAMLEKALFHFKRCENDHPGTVWAVAAKSEASKAVGVEWREGKDPNYRVGRDKEWQEAQKRVPKL